MSGVKKKGVTLSGRVVESDFTHETNDLSAAVGALDNLQRSGKVGS